MTDLQITALMHSGLVFLALASLFSSLYLLVAHFVRSRLDDLTGQIVDLEIGQRSDLLDQRVRLTLLARLAPRWLPVPEGQARAFDRLFRIGGRPAGALNGDQFLRACIMESVWLCLLAAVCLLAASIVTPVPPRTVLGVLVLSLLIGGPNIMLQVKQSAELHAANVTREVPYFLDILRLVITGGGNFRTTLDIFLRSVPSGSMRLEVQMMRQRLDMGDKEVLLQLADRVQDPATQQVITTIANGIAFFGVILSIFAAIQPVLSNFS